jgi:hypothetical protein
MPDPLTNLLQQRYYQHMHARPTRGGVHSLTDLGELAARLGALDVFDRRGDVVWMDACEDALTKRWVVTGSGSGYAAGQDWLYCKNGVSSYRLIGGSDADRYMLLTKLIASAPAASRAGFEYSFAVDSNIEYLEIGLQLFNGAERCDYLCRYTISTRMISFYNSQSDQEEIETLEYDLFEGPPGWHTWKLVIDPAEERPERVLLDGWEYPLADFSPPSAADSSNPGLQLHIKAGSVSGQNGQLYVDDILFTTNEPGN